MSNDRKGDRFTYHGPLSDESRKMLIMFLDDLKRIVLGQAELGTLINIDISPYWNNIPYCFDFPGTLPCDLIITGMKWSIDIPELRIPTAKDATP